MTFPALVLPKDAWPPLRFGGAARAVTAALYAVVLLAAAFEVARSLGRVEGVIFSGYVQLGEVVLAGGAPYDLAFNTWPPFFLLVSAVLALAARVSLAGSLLVWQVANLLAVWGCCKLLARMFEDDGAGLTFWPRSPERLAFASAAVLVPVLMTARLLDDHLQHTQLNVLLLLLVLFAFHLFRESRPALGGLSLALAASVKAVPVLLVLYLAYKRCWREVAWTAGFLVLLNVAVPAALFGPGAAAELWGTWRSVAAAQTADPTPHYMNQGMLAAVKRLVTAAGGARDPVRYAVADWSTEAARRAFFVIAGLGALGLARAFRGRPRELRGRRDAAELAVCVGAMTVVSPLAWKAHFVTLLAPYWFAWWALRRQPSGARWRRAQWGLWWGSFACLTLSAPALVGERLNNALESLNVITVGALLVLGLSLWLRPTAASPPADE